MNKKLLMRLICALLTVLTVVAMVPALLVSAATDENGLPLNDDGTYDYTRFVYESERARADAMTKYYEDDEYALYADDITGVVAYEKKATGEFLFTNPWDVARKETTFGQLRNYCTDPHLLIVHPYTAGYSTNDSVKIRNT